MLETSGKLLRLLCLLQTHRDWSGIELSERLGDTQRTVRRDVDRLRRLGYPVDVRPGSGGGYRYRCQFTVQAPADVVAEHIGPTIGVVTPLDTASCELVAGSDSLDEMALYVGLIGEEIVAHEATGLCSSTFRGSGLGGLLSLSVTFVGSASWRSGGPRSVRRRVRYRRSASVENNQGLSE